MSFTEILDNQNNYVMDTYGRLPLGISRGEGSKVWDFDGNEYLDLTSGIGVNSVGHNNPALVQAIARQAATVMHMSNLYTTSPMTETAKTLCQATGLDKMFFSNSGAESNEGAIKLARKYSFDKYGEGRHEIVTLVNSFHGRTITTLKATGQDKFHNYFFPFTEGFVYAEANNIESVKNAVSDKTCAIMLELIQGEGGVLPMDKEFVKAVRAFCTENDLLLIIDEVQTGIGRTGSLFCFQQYDILPDVVTVAKGLAGGVPIGGVLAAKTCSATLTRGTHATTFGANPLSCAAANAVLSIINDEAFLKDVSEKGKYFTDKISAIGSKHIKGVRGLGLMLGIVVEDGKHSDFMTKLMEKGVLVLTAGANAIRLLPSLTISYEEIDKAIQIMTEVFTA